MYSLTCGGRTSTKQTPNTHVHTNNNNNNNTINNNNINNINRYYVYAPSVLADYFASSKMATILGSLTFLAVLSLLVQVVFKTSIVTELEEGGYI